MRCRYSKKIYKNDENGFCVYVYHTNEISVPSSARNKYYHGEGIEFTAVGNNLPSVDTVEVDLKGKWNKGKCGLQLQVETYEEVLPSSEEGIKGYLSSGMIKGIGPKTAEQIVNCFGTRTFEILDKYPESLLQIKGITEKKLQAILSSYQESHAMRDLAAYLAPFQVSPRKIRRIYEEFQSDSLEVVKNRPFTLCQIHGFGFLTVDEIAKANQCRLNDPLRIEGCITYCMGMIMQDGHLYEEKSRLQEMVHEQLNHGFQAEVVTEAEVYTTIYHMITDGKLIFEAGMIYDRQNYEYEVRTVKSVVALMNYEAIEMKIDFILAEAQKELSLLLSEKQVEAIKMVFEHPFSIITGGPGTGKTTIQRVILYIYDKLGGKKVMLMAPTGRASRKMAESTGFADASTMHSALGLTGDEWGEQNGLEELLEADFIIADEFSMVEMSLACRFFTRIRKGTRLVLIGDVNQLPSVGPGQVFRELIQCGVIPVTVLDMVFRQNENSRIAINAQRMQDNNANLDYGTDFVFLPADNAEEAAGIIKKLYQESVERMGLDQVQILTPYRKTGAVSVNGLNDCLRELINPPQAGKAEMKAGKRTYRVGDKIIHTKNKNGLSNGDTGYVTDIYLNEDEVMMARLDFSDGRSVEYSAEELDLVELAFATTVHKSQGSEYPVIILPWLPMFYKMLKRNILYTAVTRAKCQVVIVGAKKSIYMAIHNTKDDKRNTMLGERVIKEYNQIIAQKTESLPDYEQVS